MEKFQINQQESETVIRSPCHVKQAPGIDLILYWPMLPVAFSSSIGFRWKNNLLIF